MDTESWQLVVGHENYKVSDLGRVRGPRKMLKPRNADRYFHVALYKDGKATERTVHALVLDAFVGPRPIGMEGMHKDDDTGNNRLSNLRWGTPKENQTQRHASGKRTRGPILAPGDVSRIQDLHSAGVSNTKAAQYLGINRALIPKVLENCHRYQ